MTDRSDKKIRRAFVVHKDNARRRRIPFLLTYDEWFDIWERSGRFAKRGCKLGNYCMSRFGDAGAYEVGNVAIVPTQQNQSDATRGKQKPPMSSAQKQKLSEANKGKTSYTRTDETRAKIKTFRTGNRWTASQRKAMRDNWHKARGLV